MAVQVSRHPRGSSLKGLADTLAALEASRSCLVPSSHPSAGSPHPSSEPLCTSTCPCCDPTLRPGADHPGHPATHTQLGSNVRSHYPDAQAAESASAQPLPDARPGGSARPALHSCGVLPSAPGPAQLLLSCHTRRGPLGPTGPPYPSGGGLQTGLFSGFCPGVGGNRNEPQGQLREGLRRGEGEGCPTPQEKA